VKQLFESPELYLPGFGYNVFNKNAVNGSVFAATPVPETDAAFRSIRINVGRHPQKALVSAYSARLQQAAAFKDGQLVSIQLLDNLQTDGVYISKNTRISGKGWLVSNRIYVDLGFGNTLVLCDIEGKKGIPLAQLKKGGRVSLVKSEE